MATGTNTQRWASPSPLASARHASAERKRASEEDVTKGYKTLFETVNPLIEGLNARVGTVEARLTAQEANWDVLKEQIAQLKEQNKRFQTQLDRLNNHTHKVTLETVEIDPWSWLFEWHKIPRNPIVVTVNNRPVRLKTNIESRIPT